MTTLKEDMDNIVLAAVTLGFEEQPDGKYLCSREHIISLCAIVAQESMSQVNAGIKQLEDKLNIALQQRDNVREAYYANWTAP